MWRFARAHRISIQSKPLYGNRLRRACRMTTLLIVSSPGRPRRDDEPLLGQGYPVAGEGEPRVDPFRRVESREAARTERARFRLYRNFSRAVAISRTWISRRTSVKKNREKNLECARKKKNRTRGSCDWCFR